MANRLKVGTEVKHGRGTQRMIITGYDGEYACCEWIDKDGVKHSKRYLTEELVLAVDRGLPGGKLAAARRGPAPRGEG
jgi:uncharacterized protein YodC (DUF2158 family)